MELVYLWVEDYKNIHKQGFNFSPRFSCKYDDVENELTIKENDDYIENFFGENINITAIVGKNGSGKSSVLKAFGHTWNNVYYIFSKNGQLYSNHFEIETSKYTIQQKDIDSDEIIYLTKMFFMELDEGGIFNSLTLENQNLYKKLFQDILAKKNDMLDRNIFHKNILEMILNGSLNPSYFKPTQIHISFNHVHKEFNTFNELNQIYHEYSMELSKLSIKKDKTNEDKEQEEILKKRLSSKAEYKVYLKSLEIIKENSDEELIIEFCKKDIEEILNFDYINYEDDFYFFKENDIYTFLNKFITTDIDMLSSKKYLLEDFKKEFFTKKNEDETMNIFFYLYRIGFLKYDFYDDKGNRFSNLSSGEKSIFIDFNIIRKNINTYIRDNNNFKKMDFSYKEKIELLIFIDEPDLTLHPEWQKSYIKNIIDMLKQYKDIRFHLIVTTHSPFLLSDIPKQNIIFLDKDEKGNCKVVNGLKEKKQTFGANIHTLLSDSFFMEDGLMGEFAKGKIDEVIELLNKEKLDEKELKYCEQIISIVGEPIVKNQLQRMLDSKRLKKVDEIDKIYEEIELLKHRIEILRKD